MTRKRYYSLREAARSAGIGYSTARAYVQEPRFRKFRVPAGRHPLWKHSVIWALEDRYHQGMARQGRPRTVSPKREVEGGTFLGDTRKKRLR